MVLLARSPEQLQQELNLLQKFCSHRCMEVNMAKTEIVVFRVPNVQVSEHWQLYFDGSLIQRSQESQYICTWVFSSMRVMACRELSHPYLLLPKGPLMWGMRSRFKLSHISNISMRFSMFLSRCTANHGVLW
jgi:hypothetical protein